MFELVIISTAEYKIHAFKTHSYNSFLSIGMFQRCGSWTGYAVAFDYTYIVSFVLKSSAIEPHTPDLARYSHQATPSKSLVSRAA